MQAASSHGLATTPTALVAYGSETGNAQDIAEELGNLVERLHFKIRVTELDGVALKELLQYDLVILTISTTGQGDLPANARSFWKMLRSMKLRPGCLSRMRFVSFGLGDSSYPQYQYAHRKLHNRLLGLGANSIFEKGEADEQHPEGIEGSFIQWSLNLRETLLQVYPLSEGLSPIPDEVQLPPKWKLSLARSEETPNSTDVHCVETNGRDESLVESTHSTTTPSQHLETMRQPSNPGSLVVSVESNRRVTPLTHWQDVRHLTLKTNEKHNYGPGDVLAIYPKNFAEDVDAFIESQKWTYIADQELCLVPVDSSSFASSPLRQFNIENKAVTLRWLLTNVFDIMSIPRRSFFAKLAHYCPSRTEDDIFQRDRLLEFCNPEYIDELYDYTTRPRRSILEVLQEFDMVEIPWQHVFDVIPTMRARQFSIASGGTLKGHSGNGTRFELLVAIVKYKTVIKRIRQGVCTRYIASLEPSTPQTPSLLSVELSKGSLNIATSSSSSGIRRPVVMIAPGTGVAPCRSLIYERHLSSATPSQPQPEFSGSASILKDMLFFGARNASADNFFSDEWPSFCSSLRVFTAFSRDQREKIYIQDIVKREAAEVYNALEENKGTVVVCGSSGKMPRAVREALIEVFQMQGQRMSREGAEDLLRKMEQEKRYWQETW